MMRCSLCLQTLTADVVLEAGSQQQGRGDGAQASESEHLKTWNCANGSQWEWIQRSGQSKTLRKLLV